MKASPFLSLLFPLLAGCDFLTTQRQDPIASRTFIPTKKEIAGCWHEVKNPRRDSTAYPVTDLFCVDLCFSLATDRFEQAVYTREKVSYKKHYDLFGLEWTETTRTNALKAFGTYSLSKGELRRKWDFPDPPSPDTAEIWQPTTTVAMRDDTLEAAGHVFLRPDSSRHCGTLWATFDPDPDPDGGGGGGGGIDWD